MKKEFFYFFLLFIFAGCNFFNKKKEPQKRVATDVNFLINGQDLEEESMDFSKGDIDIFKEPTKVLLVNIGEEVMFEDITVGGENGEGEWDINDDDVRESKEKKYSYTFKERGLKEIVLWRNNESTRKLIFVLGENEEKPAVDIAVSDIENDSSEKEIVEETPDIQEEVKNKINIPIKINNTQNTIVGSSIKTEAKPSQTKIKPLEVGKTKSSIIGLNLISNKKTVGTGKLVEFTTLIAPISAMKNISWDFGDGTVKEISTKTKQSHAYSRKGDYLVKMCVNDSKNCKSITIKVTDSHKKEDDFYCKNNQGNLIGVEYKACESRTWKEKAVVKFTPNRKMKILKTLVSTDNNGQIEFKLTYNSGGKNHTERITRFVNKGKSEVYLDELDIVMNSGITYSLYITPKDNKGYKPRLENIVSCGRNTIKSKDLNIDYNGSQVLFNTKYCY